MPTGPGVDEQHTPEPRFKEMEVVEEQDAPVIEGEPVSELEEETGVIITMVQGEELAWDSEVDGSEASATSTPGYCRGNHTDVSLHQVIEAIKRDNQQHLSNRQQRATRVHLLTDARMANWSTVNNIC